MKYTIVINQKAIIDNNIDIDIIDASILDYFISISTWTKRKKIIEDGKEWFWVQYESLIDSMPLL